MSTKTTTEIYDVHPLGERAKLEQWIAERQGVIVFRDAEISGHPRPDVFAPKISADGVDNVEQGRKPHWAYVVHEVVTDIHRFRFVKEWKEVARVKGHSGKRIQSKHDRLREQLGVPVYQRHTHDGVIFETAVWETTDATPA